MERQFQHLINLLDEVLAFLQSCPCDHDSPYAGDRIWSREKDLIACLAWGQYVLERNADGDIVGFMSYWKIDPADLDKIKRDEECDKIHGTQGYVVDVGCNGMSFRKLCRMLAHKGAPFNGVSSFHFKSLTHRTYGGGTLAKG